MRASQSSSSHRPPVLLSLDKLLLTLGWLLALVVVYTGYAAQGTLGIVLMLGGGVIGAAATFVWKLYPLQKLTGQLQSELLASGYQKLNKTERKVIAEMLSDSILVGEEDLCSLTVAEGYIKELPWGGMYCGIYNLSGQGFHAAPFAVAAFDGIHFPFEVVMIEKNAYGPTLEQKFRIPVGQEIVRDFPRELQSAFVDFAHCDFQIVGSWLVVDCMDFKKALTYARLGERATVIPFQELEGFAHRIIATTQTV